MISSNPASSHNECLYEAFLDTLVLEKEAPFLGS